MPSNRFKVQNFEYFKPIGYHSRNVVSVVINRINSCKRLTGLRD